MQSEVIELPSPRSDGQVSIERTLSRRRSRREYRDEPLALEAVSQLLWSAQGITERRRRPFWWPEDREWNGGWRAAPSAGALYPLEICLVAGKIQDLPAGLYVYDPGSHGLRKSLSGDLRQDLAGAALGQEALKAAPAILAITGFVGRTARKYGKRATRYVHMEVGHVGENIYLQAEGLGLGTVMIGAFRDARVGTVLQLEDGESPFALMPVGHV